MIYIRSMRLSSDEVAELERMGFYIELDSDKLSNSKALYSVFVTE